MVAGGRVSGNAPPDGGGGDDDNDDDDDGGNEGEDNLPDEVGSGDAGSDYEEKDLKEKKKKRKISE